MWDWSMLPVLGAAAVLYAALTAGLQVLRRKRRLRRIAADIAVGLIYGACAIASTHFGCNNGITIFHVRDIAPLAAGVFFSPLSGILAGTIGAAERYIAGVTLGLGELTAGAGAVSTFAAGILAAAMNKWLYKGKHPSVFHAALLGMLTETIYVYAILVLEKELSGSFARELVQQLAIPMGACTTAGFALCSAAVAAVNREWPAFGRKRRSEEGTPIATRLQRGLLATTILLFSFNFIVTWRFQTRQALENIEKQMYNQWVRGSMIYDETGSFEETKQKLALERDRQFEFLMLDSEDHLTVISYGFIMDGDPADARMIREQANWATFRGNIASLDHYEYLIVSNELDDGHTLAVARNVRDIYAERDVVMYENVLADILLFTALYFMILGLTGRLIVRNLKKVNASMDRITDGHLEETVQVTASSEFRDLSRNINKMVASLRGYILKEQKQMQNELKLAASIQESSLPRNFLLPSERVELYALMTPARQVGGDFYDFFFTGADSLCFVIADVSGKGIPAAMFMMKAKTAISYYARGENSPAVLLEKVNEALCEDNEADMFVTVWLGILNLETGVMRCASAGHEYPAVARNGREYELLKEKHGMMLATLKNIRMKEYELRLNPGDRLFVYTDGVPEAVNEAQEAYGKERMIRKLTELRGGSEQETLEGMLRDVREFAGKAEQFDDITMLGMTYLGPGPAGTRPG